MRSDAVERRLNSIPDLSRQGRRINGLFRLLASDQLWLRAYEAIAPNKGALTPGVDPGNTLDGFSLERVRRIKAAVLGQTYRFSPVRRQYIPKPNGKLRPLGIPTADDKLVQAAAKLLLERVYEPVFSDRSHGFRPGRSCHTALTQVRRGWMGVKWLVDVDVSSFFEAIDHDVLLGLLRKRIDDERLLRLVGRMLKAGHCEDWTWFATYSGTPQGGVVSPLLANVYLHELDGFMEEAKRRFHRGMKRRTNPAWAALTRRIGRLRGEVERLGAANPGHPDIPALRREAKDLELRRRGLPTGDPMDPDFRRLHYCRYADDFLIGVIGSRDDARRVMEEVRGFLAERLNLSVSEGKTGIRKASDGAPFLGYTVRTYSGDHVRRRRQAGRVAHHAAAKSDQVQLHTPEKKLAGLVEKHRLGNYHTVVGVMRPELINNSDLAIVLGYNAVLRGLAEYYKLGTSWKGELSRVHHVWWWSLMKTLARKHKTSVKGTCRRLYAQGRPGLTAEGRFYPLFRLAEVKAGGDGCRFGPHGREPAVARYWAARTDITDRLAARRCGACGADGPVEVHHARRLSDMRDAGIWTRIKAARTRKRIVLCASCHAALHAGRLTARLDRPGADVGAG